MHLVRALGRDRHRPPALPSCSLASPCGSSGFSMRPLGCRGKTGHRHFLQSEGIWKGRAPCKGDCDVTVGGSMGPGARKLSSPRQLSHHSVAAGALFQSNLGERGQC